MSNFSLPPSVVQPLITLRNSRARSRTQSNSECIKKYNISKTKPFLFREPWRIYCFVLASAIGGLNQRQREPLPPQIFFDFEVCGLHCIENYRNCCHLMSDFKAKRHKIRFRLDLRPRHRQWSSQRSTDPQLTPSPLSALRPRNNIHLNCVCSTAELMLESISLVRVWSLFGTNYRLKFLMR